MLHRFGLPILYTVTAGLCGLVITGCAPRAAVTQSIVPSAVKVRSVSSVSASGTVQGLPEYERARAACSQGKYKQAADILARLENSPTLTEDQQSFVKTQKSICLSHLITPSPHQVAAPTERRPPEIQNHADCGPRALLLACEKLGVHTDLAALTKAAGTGARGTTLQGLKRAAESVHLKAEGVQVSREALPDQPVSVAWFRGDHYVVLLALNGRGESGTALIHDPNDPAPKTVSQESLLQSSSGVLLTLHR